MSVNTRGNVGRAPNEREEFDALPRALKEIFWAAPYEFTAEGWRRRVASFGLRDARRGLVAAVSMRAAAKIPEDCGGDHPCRARFLAIARKYRGAA